MSILILRRPSGGGGGGGDNFAHGDLVEITGSGFGSTMPTFFFAGGANGVLENTTTGQTPNSGNNVEGGTTSNGFNWTRFSATEPYGTIINDGSRGKVVGVVGSGRGESSSECRFSSGVGLNSRIMVKDYCRYDAVTQTLAEFVASGGNELEYGPQWKLGTFMAGFTDISDNNGSNFKFTMLFDSPMAYCVPGGGTGADTWYLPGGNNTPVINGTWQRSERKIITPTAQGTANGQVYYRVCRNTSSGYVSDTASGSNAQLQSECNLYPNSLRYTAFTWQDWWGNGLIDGSFAHDDHYISVGSFACVELWPTTDPATSPHNQREIQEPTAWADGSITVRLNRGGLSDGTYYLVVLADSVSDTVLASRQITLVS